MILRNFFLSLSCLVALAAVQPSMAMKRSLVQAEAESAADQEQAAVIPVDQEKVVAQIYDPSGYIGLPLEMLQSVFHGIQVGNISELYDLMKVRLVCRLWGDVLRCDFIKKWCMAPSFMQRDPTECANALAVQMRKNRRAAAAVICKLWPQVDREPAFARIFMPVFFQENRSKKIIGDRRLAKVEWLLKYGADVNTKVKKKVYSWDADNHVMVTEYSWDLGTACLHLDDMDGASVYQIFESLVDKGLDVSSSSLLQAIAHRYMKMTGVDRDIDVLSKFLKASKDKPNVNYDYLYQLLCACCKDTRCLPAISDSIEELMNRTTKRDLFRTAALCNNAFILYQSLDYYSSIRGSISQVAEDILDAYEQVRGHVGFLQQKHSCEFYLLESMLTLLKFGSHFQDREDTQELTDFINRAATIAADLRSGGDAHEQRHPLEMLVDCHKKSELDYYGWYTVPNRTQCMLLRSCMDACPRLRESCAELVSNMDKAEAQGYSEYQSEEESSDTEQAADADQGEDGKSDTVGDQVGS